MHVEEFKRILRSRYGTNIEVRQDRQSGHYSLWDFGLSGQPRCIFIVQDESGGPRELYEMDFAKLAECDWASRYNGRKGARHEIARRLWHEPEERRRARQREKIRERVYGPVRDKARYFAHHGRNVGMGTSKQGRELKESLYWLTRTRRAEAG